MQENKGVGGEDGGVGGHLEVFKFYIGLESCRFAACFFRISLEYIKVQNIDLKISDRVWCSEVKIQNVED